jgi:hypothetical protein
MQASEYKIYTNNTATQNLLRSVFKMASEAGGPFAHLGYSRQGSRTSDRLG